MKIINETKKIAGLCVLGLFSGLLSSIASAEKLCVFDVVGKSGDTYAQIKDYKIQALEWGVDFKLQVYTNENAIYQDFVNGVCDASVMLGVRARSFNSFTGSIDSFGSIPDYDHLKYLLRILANPKLAKLMKNEQYEVAGIIPFGAIYLWSRDKLTTVDGYAGKKIATLRFDAAQSRAASIFGLVPVNVNLDDFARSFVEGRVDVIPGNALMFNALELYKGIGTGGRSIEPMAQSTVQVIFNTNKMSKDIAQKSRRYFYRNFNNYLRLLKISEKSVNRKYILPYDESIESMMEMSRQVRIQLMKIGIYNAQMLKLLKRVRCKKDPSRLECSEKGE